VTRGVRVNPGVRECLEALRDQMRMGIVTGSRRDHFEAMHRTSGLMPYFEFALTHDEYERSKPHPEPYLTAVERYGLDPRSCVVVEDSERGVRSAAAAGLRCIAIPNALTRNGDFSVATLVLDDVSALPAALDSIEL
jgi:HAD superfamily hydrolase (TIGR01509 family)